MKKKPSEKKQKPKKPTRKKPPTLERHKLALKIIAENIGNTKKVKEELMKLGYSESYIDSGHIKDTDSWNILVDKYLPDVKIIKSHGSLLAKKNIEFQIFPKSMSDEEITEIVELYGFGVMKIVKYETWKRAYFSILDTQAIKAGVDMAYKLKKKYGDVTILHKLGELSDEDIEAGIAGAISTALGAIAGKTKKKRK